MHCKACKALSIILRVLVCWGKEGGNAEATAVYL